MQLELIYNDKCKFCCKCVEWIRSKDKSNEIVFIGIHKNFYVLSIMEIDSYDAVETVHAITSSGTIIRGPKVVRAVLSILKYNRIVYLSKLTIIKHVFDMAYNLVNRFKHLIPVR